MPATMPASSGTTFPRTIRDISAWRKAVLGCADVGPAERVVLARFADYARIGPALTWAAASVLADDVGVSLRTVERAMATMREIGAAKVVEPATGRRAARWTLVPPSYWMPSRKAVNGHGTSGRCKGTTNAGQPCRAWPVDGLYCVRHTRPVAPTTLTVPRDEPASRSTDRMSLVAPTQVETDSYKTVRPTSDVDSVDTASAVPVARAPVTASAAWHPLDRGYAWVTAAEFDAACDAVF